MILHRVTASQIGLLAASFIFAFGIAAEVYGQEKAKPVRMGCGIMTFDTVPGWGLRPDGKSAIGPTHGAVVVDKAGNIYTSADAGVYVFSPEGLSHLKLTSGIEKFESTINLLSFGQVKGKSFDRENISC